MSNPNDDLQAELINDFIIESTEGLDLFDQEILALENNPSQETMNIIFRVIHTIKGTAGCLALNNIERISHAGENLLSLMREGTISPNQDIITSLLHLSDVLKEAIQILETTGTDQEKDHSSLLSTLEEHQDPSSQNNSKDNEAFGLFEDEITPPTPATEEQSEEKEESDTKAFGLFEDEDPSSTANDQQQAPTPSQEKESPKTKPENAKNTIDESNALNKGPSIADSAIRVSVSQLDKVMNMVGELVLARNQIVVNTTTLDETALVAASQRLNIITSELQESVMKTRMQPIANVCAKFPRVVRDVATELGKKVRLIMDGQETELDRTIIEAIKDPLTHIVRNSIDHGIESPEERIAAGKPEEGFLSLRAYHEGGQIIIEIVDDGAGINTERVKQKAVEKNLITHSQSVALSDKEATNLIFKPGFSTASKISNVSGRGVGMDVVKTNIEKTGGSVDINSEQGKGTTLKIKIPLTLAIIPALTITSGGDRYAIPQVSLLELLRLEGEEAKSQIQELYGAPVYRLRGKILPLAYLNKQLELEEIKSNSDLPDQDQVINIIVLQADEKQFGLVVDQINDTEEIVVKALGKQIKNISCFAGATIMGDGKVALILDVLGIAQHAHIIGESREHSVSNVDEKDESEESSMEELLIFTIGDDHRMAIPLSEAARLEEFDPNNIEFTGTQEVVQYRGKILPLIRVSDIISTHSSPNPIDPTGNLQVIVYSNNGYDLGLIVDSIQDIIQEKVTIHQKSSQSGISGSLVIQDKVTDMLDVNQVIQIASSRTGVVLAAS